MEIEEQKVKEVRSHLNGRRKSDMESEEKYVTFKWLIGTSLSTLGIVVAIIGIFYGMLSNTLNTKVNMELYNTQYRSVCNDIDEIKSIVIGNAKDLQKFNTNQILVMRALKIEPAK
jgi:hypothetical protein